MNTFLPYKSYERSAQVLDNRRLGKQRVEGLQIVKAHLDPKYGWQHHPAVNMWRGHTYSLIDYTLVVCRQWVDRGYKDTVAAQLLAVLAERPDALENDEPPVWIGDERVHASHRSNLLRKDPVWYGQWGWKERDDLPYVWITAEGGD